MRMTEGIYPPTSSRGNNALQRITDAPGSLASPMTTFGTAARILYGPNELSEEVLTHELLSAGKFEEAGGIPAGEWRRGPLRPRGAPDNPSPLSAPA